VGLVDFLPINALDPWVTAVGRLSDRRAIPGSLGDDLRAAGADVNEGVDLLYQLYDVGGGR
jgi:hypothetical protein